MTDPDNRPIIIGGCHRSGTSLVRRILNAHSRIYCGPEVKFFRDLYGDYFYDPLAHDRFTNTARTVLPESDLLDLLGAAFLALHERAAAGEGKARWADKTPENIVYLDSWDRLLGDGWLFIHVIRNPLDTLASIKEANFYDSIPPNLYARIDFYNRYNQTGFDFQVRQPDRYYELVYEELVSRPETVLPDLMAWLGESFEDKQLDFNRARQQRGEEDAKVGKTTRIHNESIGRWKSILTAEEAREIVRGCEPVWTRVDPAGKWMKTGETTGNCPAEELDESERTGMREQPHPAVFGELAQLSAALARQRFEMEHNQAATEEWIKELHRQIAERDRELARIKNLLPIRVLLALKQALGGTPRKG